ncbi:MAG TPA: succinylglutamate desuccinylase/aspartoacylase family protein [Candidatus Saccharimonadales bacterium]|nr:succinylglutamate desuccinylase/aspartoacylase family protein [Candidatus Saccharimonadales bacterium]
MDIAKVKVWGGTHPDEKAAIAVVESLEADPIANVSPAFANLLGMAQNRRITYGGMNLVHAFPGDPNAEEYERRRAYEILPECEGFDVNIDLHNINSGHGANFACVDKNRIISPRALGFLGLLDVDRLMITEYDGMQRHASVPDVFVLETLAVGLGSDVDRLRNAFDRLANDPDLPLGDPNDFKQFRYAGSLKVDTVEPSIVTPEIRPFEVLPDEVAAAMGFPDTQLYLSGWIDEPNKEGYWAEVCERVPNDQGLRF